MNLPNKEECFEILRKHHVPQNIIEHSLSVNKLAVFLAKKMSEKGISVNIDLIDRASRLHDIDKMQTKKNADMHGNISKKMLTEMGYPEIGNLVSLHKCECVREGLVKTWEEKILCYSDSRTMCDQIVTLNEKFEYLGKTYPYFKDPEYIEIKKQMHEIEKEIFSHLDIKPEDLKERVNEE